MKPSYCLLLILWLCMGSTTFARKPMEVTSHHGTNTANPADSNLYCQGQRQQTHGQCAKVAFISDPHIMDVERLPELVRTMNVQVQSTRLFNENIFALRAALDDAVHKGASLVVISGDMTDDGQLLNQQAAANILSEYEQRHGVRFFMTVGNHDPKSPFGTATTEKNFLATDGSTTAIYSKRPSDNRNDESTAVKVDPLLRSAGYDEELECYHAFGFMPRPDYLFWSTPFATYDYEHYTYDKAVEAGATQHRRFTYCDSISTIDPSYVVEPLEGLWLLSIDAGVYLPERQADGTTLFRNSAIGYNNVLEHKHHLLPWVRKVTAEAKRLGKTLVSFSHYPLGDFNDGASEVIRRAWGDGTFDIDRVPTTAVVDSFMAAGLQLHFAGHMHVNDTAIRSDSLGHRLVNIQTPSLATCMPAYKLLTINQGHHFHVQTVLVDSVPGFNSLFPRYQKELDFAALHGKEVIWSKEALRSRSYQEFCDWQFRDLTRLRFIKRDLPEVLRKELPSMTGEDLYRRALVKEWQKYMAIEPMPWTGFDLILDLYRLHYSDGLALKLIPQERIDQYQKVFKALRESKEQSPFMQQMRDLSIIFDLFLHDEASVDFYI